MADYLTTDWAAHLLAPGYRSHTGRPVVDVVLLSCSAFASAFGSIILFLGNALLVPHEVCKAVALHELISLRLVGTDHVHGAG